MPTLAKSISPGPRAAGALLLALCAALPAGPATAGPAPLNSRVAAVSIDTGPLDNLTGQESVVFRRVVDLGAETPWVRVRFDRIDLPAGSSVKVTSLLDGESQRLDAAQVAQWHRATGFFNGSRVRIELIAGPGSRGNRLAVKEVVAGLAGQAGEPSETICGLGDDRVPTTDPAVGRMHVGMPGGPLSGGCTGFLVDCPGSTNDKCHLSAGHCMFAPSDPQPDDEYQLSEVIEFAPPSSLANCGLVHAPMAKQFAIDRISACGFNEPDRKEWALFRVHPNPVTGRTSYEEQAALYAVAAAVPTDGDVRVTGYGQDSTGGDTGGLNSACAVCAQGTTTGERNQTLQTDTGELEGLDGDTLEYDVDTCGGNSGSPVLFGGEVVAIHTNGGCGVLLGHNSGTAVSHQPLRDALDACGPRLLVLLDRTGSMLTTRPSTGNTRCADALALARQDVASFFLTHPESGRSAVAVWTFAGSGASDLTGGFVDEATALAALDTLAPDGCGGGTPLADAICSSSDELAETLGGHGQRFLAISSDGEENASSGECAGPPSAAGPPYDPGSWHQKVYDKVVAQNVAVTRYWGGLSNLTGRDAETGAPLLGGVADEAFFAELASATGGEFQSVGDGDPLPPPIFGPGPGGPSVLEIPTLTAWGLMGMALFLVLAARVLLRRRPGSV